jgi:hypothetical protein
LNYRGQYLRHFNLELSIATVDGSELSRANATFTPGAP